MLGAGRAMGTNDVHMCDLSQVHLSCMTPYHMA